MSAITPDLLPAHALWVELATCITTPRLHHRSGDEETAVRSIHSLFGKTRELMEKNPEALEFQKLAERMLNETIRPHTARWHGWMVPDPNEKDKDGQPLTKFRDPQVRQLFRRELSELQPRLLGYVKAFEALKDGRKVNPKWTHPDVKMLTALQNECDGERAVSLEDSIEAGIGHQIRMNTGFADALDVDAINQLEREAILERRRLRTGEDQGHDLMDVSGLAFSGGGIRSATFCLGIAQVLQRMKLLPQFDYLSTVSGGGYLGGFLSCYLGTGGPVPDEMPEDSPKERLQKRFAEAFQAGETPESAAIRHLRNNSSYLLNGGLWGRLAIMGQMLAGIIFNLMLVLPLALLGALGVKLLDVWGYFGKALLLVEMPKQMTASALSADMLMNKLAAFLNMRPPPVSVVEISQSAAATWFPGWGSPALGALLTSLLILTLMMLLMPVFQRISHGSAPGTGTSTWRAGWDAACLLMLVISLLAMALWMCPALFRCYGAAREGLDVLSYFQQFKGRLDTILAVLGLGFSSVAGYVSIRLQKSGWRKKLASLTFLLSGPALLGWVFLAVGWRLMTLSNDMSWPWESVAVATVVLTAWGWLGVNVNTYSPHGYYRNRLCECYLVCRVRNEAGWFIRKLGRFFTWFWLGEAAAKRAPGAVQQGVFGTLQKLPLSQVATNHMAPYHLINTTVNLTTSSTHELRGRNGDFFLLSPKVCGSPVCGYVPTEMLEKRDAHVDLGTALAVSGAAASSNMGWKTIPSLRMIMTLANVRLGYWVPNLARSQDLIWLRGPGPKYLFREMFGMMNEHDHYLNLSDGGHIENLAVYELLRRRAKFIVCVDGGQEAGMECSDLVRLQRYAEIDLGVRLAFDPHELSLLPDGCCRAYGLLVKITYPQRQQDDGAQSPTGWMLYIKLAMTGTEPAYVLDYKRENPDFPHQTTGDQFFDEAQFEAYRSLGECAMKSFLHAGHPPADMREFFTEVVAQMLPDNDDTLKKKK